MPFHDSSDDNLEIAVPLLRGNEAMTPVAKRATFDVLQAFETIPDVFRVLVITYYDASLIDAL